MQTLVDAGANVVLKNLDGKTPMDVAKLNKKDKARADDVEGPLSAQESPHWLWPRPLRAEWMCCRVCVRGTLAQVLKVLERDAFL